MKKTFLSITLLLCCGTYMRGMEISKKDKEKINCEINLLNKELLEIRKREISTRQEADLVTLKDGGCDYNHLLKTELRLGLYGKKVYDNTWFIKSLIKKGVNPVEGETYDNTALNYAFINSDIKTIKILLESKHITRQVPITSILDNYKIKCKDKIEFLNLRYNGDELLHILANQNKNQGRCGPKFYEHTTEMVSLLRLNGAKNLENHDGYTPLDLALKNKWKLHRFLVLFIPPKQDIKEFEETFRKLTTYYLNSLSKSFHKIIGMDHKKGNNNSKELKKRIADAMTVCEKGLVEYLTSKRDKLQKLGDKENLSKALHLNKELEKIYKKIHYVKKRLTNNDICLKKELEELNKQLCVKRKAKNN